MHKSTSHVKHDAKKTKKLPNKTKKSTLNNKTIPLSTLCSNLTSLAASTPFNTQKRQFAVKRPAATNPTPTSKTKTPAKKAKAATTTPTPELNDSDNAIKATTVKKIKTAKSKSSDVDHTSSSEESDNNNNAKTKKNTTSKKTTKLIIPESLLEPIDAKGSKKVIDTLIENAQIDEKSVKTKKPSSSTTKKKSSSGNNNINPDVIDRFVDNEIINKRGEKILSSVDGLKINNKNAKVNSKNASDELTQASIIDLNNIKLDNDEINAITPSNDDIYDPNNDDTNGNNNDNNKNNNKKKSKMSKRELQYQQKLSYQREQAMLQQNYHENDPDYVNYHHHQQQQQEQHHHQNNNHDIDLDGAFDELNRFMHSNKARNQNTIDIGDNFDDNYGYENNTPTNQIDDKKKKNKNLASGDVEDQYYDDNTALFQQKQQRHRRKLSQNVSDSNSSSEPGHFAEYENYDNSTNDSNDTYTDDSSSLYTSNSDEGLTTTSGDDGSQMSDEISGLTDLSTIEITDSHDDIDNNGNNNQHHLRHRNKKNNNNTNVDILDGNNKQNNLQVLDENGHQLPPLPHSSHPDVTEGDIHHNLDHDSGDNSGKSTLQLKTKRRRNKQFNNDDDDSNNNTFYGNRLTKNKHNNHFSSSHDDDNDDDIETSEFTMSENEQSKVQFIKFKNKPTPFVGLEDHYAEDSSQKKLNQRSQQGESGNNNDDQSHQHTVTEITTDSIPTTKNSNPDDDTGQQQIHNDASTPTTETGQQLKNDNNNNNNNSSNKPSDSSNSPPGQGNKPPSSGGNNNNNNNNVEDFDFGDKLDSKKEKHWPRFNQDIYARLYAPNASISPKLSSCLVLPLSNTMRPLFPGLYCPVTVRDPAIVTEILKQTYKGFPYIGVFMRKNKTKDDSFMHKVTIPSTDSKNPPLLLGSNNPSDNANNNDNSNNNNDDGDGKHQGSGSTQKKKSGDKNNDNDNTIDDGSVDPNNLHTVGTFAHIFNITHLNNGAIHMLLVGLRRIELDSVKYDLVPNLDTKSINALVSSTVPGASAAAAAATSSTSGKHGGGAADQLDSNDVASSKDRKRHKASSSSQNAENLPIPISQSKLHSAGDANKPNPMQILEQVMQVGMVDHPQYADPSVPLPKNFKRVLIGNITHHDEESIYHATTNEDGTIKTPLELSRQEEIYKVYTAEILSAARELLQQSTPGILEQLQYLHSSFDFSNPVFVADFIANLTNANAEQMQQILSTLDITKRMHLTLLLIKREVEMTRFHANIQHSVEDNLRKTQREFYLKQQLTQIKKELGLEKGDDKVTLSNKFKLRVKNRWDHIPQHAKVVIEDELSKLDTLDTASSEYNVTRNYLEWLTILPWGHSTDEIYDIKRTERVLNEEHYGMEDVKDRILEFVAVGKLLQKQLDKVKKQREEDEKKEYEAAMALFNGTNNKNNQSGQNVNTNHEFIIPIRKDGKKNASSTDDNDENTKKYKSTLFSTDDINNKDGKIGGDKTQPQQQPLHERLLHQASTGKIMLLHGPPGVGKTSIGKSIAKSLNREFYRFSVGGLSDVSEIKGHRRTYVGALPGKIVQALKKTQCSNPVILIDEIDKIGRGGNHGDPSSALLEVLDPEQNDTFTDHYMDIPIDLSKVLFICTANSLETISGPLRDRMDLVELSGYIQQEKIHIAKHYLEPQLLTRCGLDKTDAEITLPTLQHLVQWYCREAGVRRLQKYMEMIFRKVAFRVVRNDPLPIRVTIDNLSEYVGQEMYQSDRMYQRTPVGVVAGLAWSRAGGSTMYIESAVSHSTFNRKKWGLDTLEQQQKKNNVDTTPSTVEIGDDGKEVHIQSRITGNDVNRGVGHDSVQVFEVHGGNKISTNVDVVTQDTEIIIETNDKHDGPSDVNKKQENGGLAPTRSNKKNKKNKNNNNNNDNTNNNNNNDDGSDDDDDADSEVKDGNGGGGAGGNTGSLKLTGSLGEVMKESASIAYTLAKFYLHKLNAEYEANKIINGIIPDEKSSDKNKGETEQEKAQNTARLEKYQQEFDLTIQDDPVDPLHCQIPILRPPISNSTSVGSKIIDTNLSHKQSQSAKKVVKKVDDQESGDKGAEIDSPADKEAQQLQAQIAAKLQELQSLQSKLNNIGQVSSLEDELFPLTTQVVSQSDQTKKKSSSDQTITSSTNPQTQYNPGDTYITPKTASLPKKYLPVPNVNFFNTANIHIHAPQGATPKDGPSAGIALLSILMSQALNRPLVNNIAMTGEISLTGKVLPIGGLREKILGARQSHIYHLIVPKANMHDIAELPSYITSGLTIYFAETCDEVIRLVFGAPNSLLGGEGENFGQFNKNVLPKPTLIKKYDVFDGNVDLEILKSQQALEQKNNTNDDNNENNEAKLTEAEIVNNNDDTDATSNDTNNVPSNSSPFVVNNGSSLHGTKFDV